ncbi:calcium-binding protein [Dapis sp. BLCC M229]|uniref:calcium-binding protein n=1 Tax=Dapis sp. BLCC M229 TaxID=3400188 RepID=UPI003CF21D99
MATATEGNDVLLVTSDDNFHVNGGDGNDLIIGFEGDDELLGGNGNDILIGGAGYNFYMGGNGADVFGIVDDGLPELISDFNTVEGDVVMVSAEDMGSDLDDYSATVSGGDTYLEFQGSTFAVLNGVENFDVAENLKIINGPNGLYQIGSNGNDSIESDDNSNIIVGLEGNDTLNGQGGNDALYGGGDDDHLIGMSGKDSLYGGEGNDYLSGRQGNDTLDGGEGNDILYGNKNGDVLIGNLGNDFLDGGSGNDTVDGGSGNDTLVGGSGSDTFILENSGSYPIIKDFNASEGDIIQIDKSEYGINSIDDLDLSLNPSTGTVMLTNNNIWTWLPEPIVTLENPIGFEVSNENILLI